MMNSEVIQQKGGLSVKKLRLIIPLLLICTLLTGCGFFFPYFFLNFPESDTYEEVRQLPIGTDVDPKLSADDVYWRSKFAATERALQYSENATIELAFDDEGFEYWVDMHYNTNVTLDPDNSAVNVETLLSFGDEEPEQFWDYYRDENGRLIRYSHEVESDSCTREEIPLNGKAPYVIIPSYTVYGYPYDPENIAIEPQTRILNDREVYMLTYKQAAINVFGATGNADRDQKLSQRSISGTWYVDAQTYLPVRQEYILTQVDDLLGEMVDAMYQISAAELDAAITGYTLSIDYASFEPVELPPVPDAVLRKAWNNAGFSAN